MNPDVPQNPREELEVRLTALLLGELPDHEAAAVRQAIAADPELAALFGRLKETIELVRETAASPAGETASQPEPLKLSEERRETLLAKFKTVTPKEFVAPRRREIPWYVPMSIAAVLVAMIGLAVLMPAVFRSREEERVMAVQNMNRLLNGDLREIDQGVPLGLVSPTPPSISSEVAAQDGFNARSAPSASSLSAGPEKKALAARAYSIATGEGMVTNNVSGVGGVDLSVKSYAYRGYTSGVGDRVGGGGAGGRGKEATVTVATSRQLVAETQRQLGEANQSVPDVFFEARYGKGSSTQRPAVAAKGAFVELPVDRFQSAERRFVPLTSAVDMNGPAQPTRAPEPAAEAKVAMINQDDNKALGFNENLQSAGARFDFGRIQARGDGNATIASGAKLPALLPNNYWAEPATAAINGRESSPVASATKQPMFGDSPNSSGLFRTALPVQKTNGSYSLEYVQPEEKLVQQVMSQADGKSGGRSPTAGALFADADWMAVLELPSRPDPSSASLANLFVGRYINGIADQNGINAGIVGRADSFGVHALGDGEAAVKIGKPVSVDGLAVLDARADDTVEPLNRELKRNDRPLRDIYAESEKVEKNLAEVGKSLRGIAQIDALESKLKDAFKDESAHRSEFYSLELTRQAKASEENQNRASAARRSMLNLEETPVAIGKNVQPLGDNALPAKSQTVPPSSVYSVNPVGYVDTPLPHDLKLITGLSTTAIVLPQLDDFAIFAKQTSSELARTPRLSEAASSALGKPAVVAGDDVSAPKPVAPALIPQPEMKTRENAFSTFSLNVSDVSFKLAAASLEKGVMPELATVRSEEFINAFDYRDPAPPAGVPVGFAWDRARYPFAHNRDLLRFSIKTAAAGRETGRPLNLVLLLDNSGSMERADRVGIIHEALRVLSTQLQAQDKISVVTFARTARLWADGASGTQAAQIAEQVGGITPEGGTNLEEAMNLAYQTALRHYLAHGMNRVVLLTDGAANLGNTDAEALKQKVEAHRKQGIALDCFGIGWEGFNDDLLENLSRNGDGRYGFINTPEEAATEFASQLAGALQVAASDVKVQIEFNPRRVVSYRQIGYAKHQLTKEQFRDNTVDAAEIAAAESGNALYTIETNPQGNGPIATVRVRFKIPGTTDYREHEWAVPFRSNVVSMEQAGPAMRLAATSSAFSEWLASSAFASDVTPDRLLGYLSGVAEVYGADARPKKLEWMIRQARSIAGK